MENLLSLICIIFVCHAHLNIFTSNLRDINVYIDCYLGTLKLMNRNIYESGKIYSSVNLVLLTVFSSEVVLLTRRRLTS